MIYTIKNMFYRILQEKEIKHANSMNPNPETIANSGEKKKNLFSNISTL